MSNASQSTATTQRLQRGAMILLGSGGVGATAGCLAGLLHLAGDTGGARFFVGLAAVATTVAGLTACGLILLLIRSELRRDVPPPVDPK